MTRRIVLLPFLVFALLISSGQGCKKEDPGALALARPVTINIWRPFDGADAFENIIAKYRSVHPNVTINYRKLRPETYEQELLEAFAEDRGPDIFAVHNTWLRGYQSKLAPMPGEYRMANIIPKGGFEGKVEIQAVNKRGLTPRQLSNSFLDVVVNDVVLPADGSGRVGNLKTDKVYGLPLAVDTMMLFYNKDLINAAGVAEIPETWTGFQSTIEGVTVIDENFKLIRPGAVIGTAENVPRSSDLLALIMMQAGAQMSDDFGNAVFHLNPPGFDRATPPGIDALRFYTDFSIPTRDVYTWNALQPDGLEAFIQGRVAFMFGYAYQLPLIQARSPKLQIGVAPVPQQLPNQPINIANYWLESVSKKSEAPNVAWDFILFATAGENVRSYLTATQKPTAIRSLVSEQREDLTIGPFADQLLTAQSWYRGKDGNVMDDVMQELITNTHASIEANDNEAFEKAVNNAVSKLNQTL